jgi:hypothetical protein
MMRRIELANGSVMLAVLARNQTAQAQAEGTAVFFVQPLQ